MRIDLYQRLRRYEHYLYTALKAGYIRSLTSVQMNELSEIGAEIGIPYKHTGCPLCALKFVKALAVPYFDQQEKMKNKKAKKGNDDEQDNSK